MTKSLAEIEKTIRELASADETVRCRLMEVIDGWEDEVLAEGAASLLLRAAAADYPILKTYPPKPNERLIRVLWSGSTRVDPSEVHAVYDSLDEDCQASALRLLAELESREASHALARILTERAGRMPKALWPVLLPLERKPRDPDLLVGPLLAACADEDWARLAGGTLLAYAKADLLDDDMRRSVGRRVTAVLTQRLTVLSSLLADQGDTVRWTDEYRFKKAEAGLLLDLLSVLCTAPGVNVLFDAANHADPWVALWGLVGCLRAGRDDVPTSVYTRVAGNCECRSPLAELLYEVGELERFPDEYWNQRAFAESEMVRWLVFPTELNRAPDELEAIGVRTIETKEGDADLYIFRFRTHPPHWSSDKGWMVGVAGPFLENEQPTPHGLGMTFSQFRQLDELSIDEHVEAILGNLK